MENSNSIFTIILIAIVLLIIVFAFIKVSLIYKRGGGTKTLLTFGATDEFYNKEQKEAIEMIVDLNAGKKMDEQSSDEPD